MKKLFTVIGVVTFLLFASCDKADNTETILEATSLELISGDNQSGNVVSTLQALIVVSVKDQNGDVFQGATVKFNITEGSVSQETVITEENGEVSVEWILGPTEGEQIITITAFKSDGTTQLNGSPVIVKANATESMPNNITYTGEHSGTYKVSGTAVDAVGNPLSEIKIECHLFEDGGDYASIVGPLYVKTKIDGKYSFDGLPNPDLYEELNISMYTFTLYSADYLDASKYEGSNCWVAGTFGGDFPTTEMKKDLLLLEINSNTVLKGTIKYADGTPVPANRFGGLGITYGQHDEYQAFVLVFEGGNYRDDFTGSFYDETTGEFQLLNCLKGGDHNYTLHINHVTQFEGNTYSEGTRHVTISEGIENEVAVTIVKN